MRCASAIVVQVLEEVADYIPYNIKSKARYRLKKEAWRLFDPHFPRYGPHELQEALARAAVSPCHAASIPALCDCLRPVSSCTFVTHGVGLGVTGSVLL